MHIQSNWAEFAGVTSGAVSLSSIASGADVSSGSLLVAAAVNRSTSNRRVSSFADDNGNTWAIDQDPGNISYNTSIGSAQSANSGATQITVTWNFSTTFVLVVTEASGYGANDTSDTRNDTVSDTNDKCSAGLTTASNVYVIAGGSNNSSHGGHSPPSGWTMIRSTAAAPAYAVAYVESSGLSSDEVVFTHTVTARTWKGSVASYVSTGGGGGSTGAAMYRHLQTMGAY